MACYHPMTAYRSAVVNASGKRSLVFNPTEGYSDLKVVIPCGQCIGCRLERSRQWAIRCVHEASLYDKNCFITLTYNDDHLPADGGLDVSHFQKFMKRLRKRFSGSTAVYNSAKDKYEYPIRFFQCGEYGSKNFRPHYHACLFNFDFPDLELFTSRDGINLYTSQSLSELWPFGFSTVGAVTFDSAAYVARYIMKKVTGDRADSHYQTVDSDTGEVYQVKPEYTTMSRRPGIASGWFDKYRDDVFPRDYVVLNNRKLTPPKFYDVLLERTHQEQYDSVKLRRIKNSVKLSADNTYDRLSVKEQVKLASLSKLKRPLEDI